MNNELTKCVASMGRRANNRFGLRRNLHCDFGAPSQKLLVDALWAASVPNFSKGGFHSSEDQAKALKSTGRMRSGRQAT
jgi:hypothetical protein